MEFAKGLYKDVGRRRRLLISGTTVLVLALPACTTPARAANDVQMLRRLEDASDSEGRRRVCQQILDLAPAPYARSFCIGYQAIFAGSDEIADQSLQEVLHDMPDLGLAPILYGEAYEEMKKLDRAEAMYRKAIEIQPNRTDARFALGSLYLRRAREGDPKYLPQALEAFREMTEKDPSSPDGWGSMGVTLTYMGRLADAEMMFRKAVTKNPKDPALYDNLASLYARENKSEEAASNWRKALSLNPGYGKAVIELAALYGRTGRLALAIRTLEDGTAAVEAPPWGPRVLRNLGFAYLRLDQRDLARSYLTRAVGSGIDALACLGLAHLRMLEDSVKTAVPLFAQGAQMDSTLAVPFVQAWQDTLSARGAGYLALRRIMRRTQNPSVLAAADSTVRLLPPGVKGAGATAYLVGGALENWSFEGAALALRELRAFSPDSISGQYDSAPVPLTRAAPDYPETYQEQGEGGTVQVLVMVDENGRVTETSIKLCDAPLPLCDSAESAARRWTFKPAMRFGHPVKATVVLPFHFGKSE